MRKRPLPLLLMLYGCTGAFSAEVTLGPGEADDRALGGLGEDTSDTGSPGGVVPDGGPLPSIAPGDTASTPGEDTGEWPVVDGDTSAPSMGCERAWGWISTPLGVEPYDVLSFSTRTTWSFPLSGEADVCSIACDGPGWFTVTLSLDPDPNTGEPLPLPWTILSPRDGEAYVLIRAIPPKWESAGSGRCVIGASPEDAPIELSWSFKGS